MTKTDVGVWEMRLGAGIPSGTAQHSNTSIVHTSTHHYCSYLQSLLINKYREYSTQHVFCDCPMCFICTLCARSVH